MNNVLKTIFAFSFGVAASTAYADRDADQEAGQESLLYPSDTSALFVPAGYAFEKLPFLGLSLLSGGGNVTVDDIKGQVTASGYTFAGMTEALDKGTMRLGIERKSIGAKTAIKIPVSETGDIIEASAKSETESTSILVSFLTNDSLAVGAKISSTNMKSQLSVPDIDISDEGIWFQQLEFCAAMRQGGMEYVLSYSPGANVRNGSLESEEEPAVSLGATLIRERFNISAGIGLHAYNAINKEYDDKASFIVGLERKVNESQQLAVVAESQPPYYKSIDGLNAGSIGGTSVKAIYKVRFGNSMQADLAYGFAPKSTKSETDDSGTFKRSTDNSFLGVNLKKYF
jgi:hypothetical protein